MPSSSVPQKQFQVSSYVYYTAHPYSILFNGWATKDDEPSSTLDVISPATLKSCHLLACAPAVHTYSQKLKIPTQKSYFVVRQDDGKTLTSKERILNGFGGVWHDADLKESRLFC